MENPGKIGTFSSCRGVSFEIKPHLDPFAITTSSSCRGVSFETKPHLDPFAITTPAMNETRGSKRFWLPWGSSSLVVPSLNILMQRYSSRASSHFCDLDLEDDEDYYSMKAFEEGNEEEELKPVPLSLPLAKPKGSSRLSIILLHQGLFTVYERLFAVCLALNITGLALAATGHFPYARRRAALFSIGNILTLTLCRSEAFLRIVFWLAVNILGWSWVPLRLKTATTSLLQSLGGIHSSCGLSSIAWLIYAWVLTLKDKENTSPVIIGVASVILYLLCLSALAAFPLVRHLHHNIFERTHRFAGWTALGFLWAFILLAISFDPKTKSYSNRLGSRLIKEEEFWLTLVITVLIIIPWVTVRRVPVKVSAPSGHASIIKFEGGVKAGILGRISTSPLSEWHAFGIISDGKKEHMMLAGAVGDFTKSLVSNPPSHLWVRQVNPADVCLLWVAKGIEQNFGKEIKEMVSGCHKEKVIVHDTAVLGRPNVSQMSVDAARSWRSQVVIVTSNPEGSRDVVKACKAAGIPAFGPIWDS
ncbi:hypothetical protein F0562_018329 [Nyssa sinensis]|uniref:Uncharacterized protein n=1 Tax=Nyssa sinensis TaxID=561372 RepID=A0A5J4Z9R3_9ASTE|nr:hypothetical protein F0562_018329 [Nyssa sinensis]